MKNKKLIVLGGPTAVGKTKFAIKLAKKIKSEIISADARQFYKELNIGVGKPNQKELHTIQHHFIGHLSIENNYSIGKYEKDGLVLLDELFKKYDTLILCGGSGLYIDAITEGLNEFPKINKLIREQLNHEFEVKGLNYLNQELKSVDKVTYDIIDKKNHRRIIRALEVYRSSGIPYSDYKKVDKNKRNFDTLFIALQEDREFLYKKINERVDIMVNNGLIDEVKSLYKYRDKQALQTIGYQEIIRYINKEISAHKAIEEIKKNTRRYAKRQINWFSKSKYQQYNSKQLNEVINLIKIK